MIETTKSWWCDLVSSWVSQSHHPPVFQSHLDWNDSNLFEVKCHHSLKITKLRKTLHALAKLIRINCWIFCLFQKKNITHYWFIHINSTHEKSSMEVYRFLSLRTQSIVNWQTRININLGLQMDTQLPVCPVYPTLWKIGYGSFSLDPPAEWVWVWSFFRTH